MCRVDVVASISAKRGGVQGDGGDGHDKDEREYPPHARQYTRQRAMPDTFNVPFRSALNFIR